MDFFYPSFQKGYYAIIDGVIFGPFGVGTLPSYQMIPFSGSKSFWEPIDGPYGENIVTHEKLGGAFMYQPVFPNIVPGASWAYPRACTLLTTEGGKTALNGMFMHCGTAMGSFYWQPEHFAFLYNPKGDVWTMWKIVCNWNNWNTVQAVYQTEIAGVHYRESDQALVGQTRWRYCSGSLAPGFPGRDMHTLFEFKEYMSYVDGLPWVPWVGGWQTGSVAHGYSPSICDDLWPIDSCRSKLDAMMYMLLPETFPLQHMPSGDLVMRAAEKKRVITTNMISFTRDLKDVKELIPKLKNLASLKEWFRILKPKGAAGEYLSVQYGILPTISDLKSIWEAAHKNRSNKLLNGDEVYYSRHVDSSISEGMAFSLEQHVKIVIAAEDNMFDQLCEKLDTIGFLPTFKNVWDLINYSFVLDWFIDVGDLLDRVDNCLRLLRYDIRYTVLSYKETAEGSSPGTASYPFIGTFSWVKYHRWVSLITPLPPISLSVPSKPFSHWLESGALLTQRFNVT